MLPEYFHLCEILTAECTLAVEVWMDFADVCPEVAWLQEGTVAEVAAELAAQVALLMALEGLVGGQHLLTILARVRLDT